MDWWFFDYSCLVFSTKASFTMDDCDAAVAWSVVNDEVNYMIRVKLCARSWSC